MYPIDGSKNKHKQIMLFFLSQEFLEMSIKDKVSRKEENTG